MTTSMITINPQIFYNPNVGLGSPAAAGNALERWHAAHRFVFAVWNHVVVALSGMSDAFCAQDEARYREFARSAAAGFGATSACFVYASSMSPAEFESVVKDMQAKSGYEDFTGASAPGFGAVYGLFLEHAELGIPQWAKEHAAHEYREYVEAVRAWYCVHRECARRLTETRECKASLSGSPIDVLAGRCLERVMNLLHGGEGR